MTNNRTRLNSESFDPNASELDPIMANESDPYSPPNQVVPIIDVDQTDVPPSALDGAGDSSIPYRSEDGDKHPGGTRR